MVMSLVNKIQKFAYRNRYNYLNLCLIHLMVRRCPDRRIYKLAFWSANRVGDVGLIRKVVDDFNTYFDSKDNVRDGLFLEQIKKTPYYGKALSFEGAVSFTHYLRILVATRLANQIENWVWLKRKKYLIMAYLYISDDLDLLKLAYWQSIKEKDIENQFIFRILDKISVYSVAKNDTAIKFIEKIHDSMLYRLYSSDPMTLIEESGLFDHEWYLSVNSDVAKSGIDPVQHYLKHGAMENRDPTPWFSTSDYRQQFSDESRKGVNPLLHYILVKDRTILTSFLSNSLSRCMQIGLVGKAQEIANYLFTARGIATRIKSRAKFVISTLQEVDEDWLPELPDTYYPKRILNRQPANIIHLFKTVLPYENSGGAIRCRNIVDYQKYIGLCPVVVTPLGYPGEATGSIRSRKEVINGIDYYFKNFVSLDDAKKIPVCKRETFDVLLDYQLLKKLPVDLIQASSGFRGYELAQRGIVLARALGVPFVYEVRSFHEHTWRSHTADVLEAEMTQLRIRKENRCMQMADTVVTICDTMKQKLIDRGINGDKIFVIPNGVNSEKFSPELSTVDIKEKYAIGSKTVIGYISNLSKREGHSVLLQALNVLVNQKGLDVAGLIVGDGPTNVSLQKQSKMLGLGDNVIFTGTVPHDEIIDYYNAIDIFVVPRIEDFASDFVTPMKPYEALAMKKPVLVSDRPVLQEIIHDGETGLVFKTNDVDDLATKIAYLMDNTDVAARLAENGRNWVEKNSSWESIIHIYKDVYAHAAESLLKRQYI